MISHYFRFYPTGFSLRETLDFLKTMVEIFASESTQCTSVGLFGFVYFCFSFKFWKLKVFRKKVFRKKKYF